MALFKSEKVRSNVWGKAGDYFLDLSKLIFAGVILAAIVDADLPRVLVIVGGAGATLLTLFLGVVFTLRNEQE
jgi:uncharacterized membrane protein YraQ (UPF0718 family)